MSKSKIKILVYGFKPFLQYKENITEKIVERLKKRGGLYTVVLPVKFDRKIFADVLAKYKPDIVMGLGQTTHAGKIRIERKAVNIKKFPAGKPEKIDKNGPAHRFVNLKLKPTAESRATYDAGTYVCNYSMYIVPTLVKERELKFAYLHIPKDYDIKKATKFVEAKIDEVM